MPKKILFLIFSFVGCIAPCYSNAQDSVRVDISSEVDVRFPDESVIESYANDPDFQYLIAPENPNSLRERLFNYIIGFIFRLIGNPIGGFIFRAMLILAVASLVIVLINQLVGGELIYVFKKNRSEEGFNLGIEQDELKNTDYELLLKDAIRKEDFHAATRFGYLIALKLLTQNELIAWGLQKTNLDYLKELTGHRLVTDFKILTTYYEYVEYGDFEINSERFQTFRTTLNRFKSSVNES